MREDTLQLTCADHARLVYHQHIAGREQVAALLPAML
jgi:hypothetical protein